MDLLCQLQADVLGVPVRRPEVKETTAVGAAYLAGIAEGVWADPSEAASAWREEAAFVPELSREEIDSRYAQWRRAVERARRWATEDADEA